MSALSHRSVVLNPEHIYQLPIIVMNYWFDLFDFCHHHTIGAILIQCSTHLQIYKLICNAFYVLACTKTLYIMHTTHMYYCSNE
jgi:hypothetical protein